MVVSLSRGGARPCVEGNTRAGLAHWKRFLTHSPEHIFPVTDLPGDTFLNGGHSGEGLLHGLLCWAPVVRRDD